VVSRLEGRSCSEAREKFPPSTRTWTELNQGVGGHARNRDSSGNGGATGWGGDGHGGGRGHAGAGNAMMAGELVALLATWTPPVRLRRRRGNSHSGDRLMGVRVAPAVTPLALTPTVTVALEIVTSSFRCSLRRTQWAVAAPRSRVQSQARLIRTDKRSGNPGPAQGNRQRRIGGVADQCTLPDALPCQPGEGRVEVRALPRVQRQGGELDR